MGLSREELIDLGQSVPTELLAEWVGAQRAVARRAAERLEARGVRKPFLAEIDTLLRTVEKLEGEQERGKKILPEATDRLETIRDAALDWYREVRDVAKVEFGADPHVLARFRTGVRIGGSTPKLIAEFEFLLPLLREHRTQLAWLGVTEGFVKKGDALLGQLREADAAQESLRKALSPKTAELNEQKGRLYELSRKLVRIGRLEFRREPQQAAQFNYEILRRQLTGARAARTARAAVTPAS